MGKKPYVPKCPGAKLDRVDPRDYREREISAPKRAPTQDIIDTYGREYRASDLAGDYQDGQPECVLQSYSFLYRQLYKEKYGEDIDMSECFAYAMAEKDEPGPPDKGSYSRLGAKVFQKYGVCEAEYYQPDRQDTSFKEYVDTHNIPQEATDNARNHKVKAYARVDGLGWGEVSLEGILNAIVRYGGCEVALRGTKEDWLQESGIIDPPSSDDYFYHGVALNGWKAEDGWKDNPEDNILVRGLNWWDEDREGQLEYAQGSFYFKPSEYLNHINGSFVLTGLEENDSHVEGWVVGNYIRDAKIFQAGDKIATTANLHVRDVPMVRNNVVGTIRKGRMAEVLEHEKNGIIVGGYRWWRVKVDKENLKTSS